MKELLAPAGNMECLHQAVYNGCDAVYIAGQKFGARKFAANFSNEELVEAIKFCHLYGVKVYVTMNTLVKNDEVSSFLEQIRFLHKSGVDAVIMQDIGMICLVREMFPNLDIHASTQANNSSYDTVKMFYDLGVKRVVFSRELTVDEIDGIDVPIEKEAFIHGALCVSYSGCCLMSSMLGGRSGNRGECAGVCRMSYDLVHDGKTISKDKYLLSMKELNTSSKIDRLLDSSIYSFKIEGRMKSPLYVGFITRFYRKLIDKEEIDFSWYTDELKTIFNREFTAGHMFYVNDKTIINDKFPNHIGLKIGSCCVYKDKIKIILDKNREIHQNDAIRFMNSNLGMIVNYLYDKDLKLCSSCSGVCFVDNKVGLVGSDILSKTQDSLLDEEFILDKPIRRIGVSYSVFAHVGEKLFISMSDGVDTVSVLGDEVLESINAPVGKDSIERSLSRLVDSPYEVSSIDFDIDDKIFIPIKKLNDARRELVLKLNEIRSNKKSEFIERDVSFSRFDDKVESLISCSVFSEEQLLACLYLDRIYVRDLELYNKYKDYDNVYYYLPRCSYKYKDTYQGLVSDFMLFDNSFGNYGLNVTNIYTAYYLRRFGLLSICLSVELSDLETKQFINEFNDKFGFVSFEMLSYGRVLNMLIKGNILGIDTFDYKYFLVDGKKRQFPIYFDGVCTNVLNYINRDNYMDIDCCMRLDFYDEDYNDVLKILEFVRKKY